MVWPPLHVSHCSSLKTALLREPWPCNQPQRLLSTPDLVLSKWILPRVLPAVCCFTNSSDLFLFVCVLLRAPEFHVVRIRTARLPRSRNSRASPCAGCIFPSNMENQIVSNFQISRLSLYYFSSAAVHYRSTVRSVMTGLMGGKLSGACRYRLRYCVTTCRKGFVFLTACRQEAKYSFTLPLSGLYLSLYRVPLTA